MMHPPVQGQSQIYAALSSHAERLYHVLILDVTPRQQCGKLTIVLIESSMYQVYQAHIHQTRASPCQLKFVVQ